MCYERIVDMAAGIDYRQPASLSESSVPVPLWRAAPSVGIFHTQRNSCPRLRNATHNLERCEPGSFFFAPPHISHAPCCVRLSAAWALSRSLGIVWPIFNVAPPNRLQEGPLFAFPATLIRCATAERPSFAGGPNPPLSLRVLAGCHDYLTAQ